ncbi:hypothetical protein BpHYR1_004374 [Brachionus plicatilis]|uniref:Uncharacterized protein n=1 Tax=Brachionus plicatilis TaxID=10195 RepID=A0A3M7Q4X6_BRAPC|nr:hypothetical protein BpHYR1_004374 [Brachionus plicatilis]
MNKHSPNIDINSTKTLLINIFKFFTPAVKQRAPTSNRYIWIRTRFDVLANVRFVIAGTTTLAVEEVLIVECDDSEHVDFTDENIEALPTCLLQRALIGCNIGWLKLVLL